MLTNEVEPHEAEPVACTLLPGDREARVAWIETLSRQSLRSSRRDDLTLRLTYGPEASEAVRELVAREKSCCSFMRFELHEDETAVNLAITAPERARDAADWLFAHFLPASA